MVDKRHTYSVMELQRAGILLVEDGNHGEFRPRADEFVNNGVAFIRAADMDSGRVLFESAAKINDRARKRITKGIGAPGDILLSHKGTVGKVAMVPDNAPAFVCSPQTTFWRSKDTGKLDRKYLYAFLRSPHFHGQLATRAGETDMAPYVSLTSQRGLIVTLLPIEEQRTIARILGALDDKIELNRRMSGTLEAMERALFKSWFVDFDPVRAKAKGRDPGLPGHTANLFPGSFVASELGETPEGWPVRPLSEVLKESNERVGDAEVPEYSSTNEGLQPRSERFTKQLAESSTKNKLIRKGYLIFGLSRRVLNFGLMRDDVGSVSGAYKVLEIEQESIEPDLLERMMRTKSNYFYNAVSASSREGQSVSSEGLGHLRFVQPNRDVQDAYYRVTGPLRKRLISLQHESRALTDMRDALLPKLISGELRLKDADRFIEEVVA